MGTTLLPGPIQLYARNRGEARLSSLAFLLVGGRQWRQAVRAQTLHRRIPYMGPFTGRGHLPRSGIKDIKVPSR